MHLCISIDACQDQDVLMRCLLTGYKLRQPIVLTAQTDMFGYLFGIFDLCLDALTPHYRSRDSISFIAL